MNPLPRPPSCVTSLWNVRFVISPFFKLRFIFVFQGRKFQRIPLNENSPDEDLNELQQICSEGRLKMIESLSDFDDQIADLILSDESGGFEGVSEDDIKQVGQLA